MQTGHQLRQLFATLLLFCSPSHPDQLWNEFRDHICDDVEYRLQTHIGLEHPSQADIYDYGLTLLNDVLKSSSKNLASFSPPMPLPQRDWVTCEENYLIADQRNYNQEEERCMAEEIEPQLNLEQRMAYFKILESVEAQTLRAQSDQCGQHFFLNGPGGTGKTFVYKALCHAIRAVGRIVLCVASSGIAALLLPGGRTSHSMLKIPVGNLSAESVCPINKQGLLAELIRQTNIIIWDEVPMQHRFGPEAVDRTCQDLRNNPNPFGGITVVFGGDFQQILPVVRKGSREAIVEASIQRSCLWEEMSILSLRTNMRLDQDQESQAFAKWLLDVGHGHVTAEDTTVRLPEYMKVNDVVALTDFVYPGVSSKPPPPPEYFLDRAILAARNDHVNQLNVHVLEQLDGEERVYMSADTVILEDGADGPASQGSHPYPLEFLQSLNPPGLPPSELHLKIGCPLILLNNLAPSRGLCNGTRMVLIRMSDRVLEVKIIGGDHHGQFALIPRISLIPSTDTGEFPFTLRRRQFPVRLAFAMSINKAQGQSIKVVGLDFRVPVFTHGQLYVALSRATSGQRIRVLLPDNMQEPITHNIVFSEVLLD